MIEIRRTEVFDRWLARIRDRRVRTLIADRLTRVEEGNYGDVRPVGEGVSELRIHYGPGYRVYFVQQGTSLVILLAGGDKSTQQRDIRRAVEMAREFQGA
ncbi:MAG: type II toxin-antitoxin system RelE/ParE family toxin [Chloroflexota bacterium]|nr:type II toxin-antitoxin system RelE/ParE family toxin [Chloroflexota bacterium]